MKKVILSVFAISVALISCQNNGSADSETSSKLIEDSISNIDMHTSQIALDWNGVYEGTLPCADCPGIKTTIELRNNNTFTQHLEYLDRDTEFNETGKIEWNESGNDIILISENGGRQLFKVKEGSLAMLDSYGKEDTSSLADHYILNKKN